jgi:hypothetical protein
MWIWLQGSVVKVPLKAFFPVNINGGPLDEFIKVLDIPSTVVAAAAAEQTADAAAEQALPPPPPPSILAAEQPAEGSVIHSGIIGADENQVDEDASGARPPKRQRGHSANVGGGLPLAHVCNQQQLQAPSGKPLPATRAGRAAQLAAGQKGRQT